MDMGPTPSAAAAAVAVQAYLTLNHGVTALERIHEPLDCSSPILDLCIRRRSRAATPEMRKPTIFAEKPTSTMDVSSPGSQASSETSDTSISSDLYRDVRIRSSAQTIIPKMKIPRPFKAYPKNPLSLAAAECVLSKESAEAYSEFRNQMLAQVQANNGITNKNMRRTSQGINSHNRDDANYWEKRRKNNEAAKRSRDARRAKEDELAIRAAFLERENLHLRCEVANMRLELEELRSVVYRRPVV